jgi:hypothetical protein
MPATTINIYKIELSEKYSKFSASTVINFEAKKILIPYMYQFSVEKLIIHIRAICHSRITVFEEKKFRGKCIQGKLVRGRLVRGKHILPLFIKVRIQIKI